MAENHQGAMKGRSAAIMAADIINQINAATTKHEATALVAIDQSAFYDVIKHETLLSKMRHLNFKDKTFSYVE